MDPGRNLFGLSAQAKAKLIKKLSGARPRTVPAAPEVAPESVPKRTASRLDLADLEGYRDIEVIEHAF